MDVNIQDNNNIINPKGMDDLLNLENSDLQDRISDLERTVRTQVDEIVCLRSALSDCLRRLTALETKGTTHYHVPSPNHTATLHHAAHCLSATDNLVLQGQLSPRPVGKGGVTSHSKRSTGGSHHSRLGTGSDSSMRRSNNLSSSSAPGHSPRVSSSRAPKTSSGSGIDQPLHVQVPASHSSGPKEAVWVKEEGILRIYLRGRAINMYSPTDFLSDNRDVHGLGEAPTEKLKMEWVYGYRGRDCRNNLHFLPTGEMVYFIASIVVLHNVEENMQRHYTGHTDDVKSMAVHPDRITIATGQVAGHDKSFGKPHVRVWNSVDLNTLHVLGLGDFERSVCCIAFSRADGGDLLCAVDEANEHIISVWEWRKTHKITETKASTEPVLAAEFHPLDARSIVTCGKNMLAFWTLENVQLTKKNGIYEKHDKPKFVTCITFAGNGDLITGDSNGNIFVWARGGNKITHSVSNAHEGGIFNLCVLKDDKLISGGKDRKIQLWDAAFNRGPTEAEIPEQYGPIRTLSQGPGGVILVGTTKNCILQGSFDLDFTPIVTGHTEELWGLCGHPSQMQFASCGYDRQVVFWDALTRQTVWSKELNDSAHSVAFHPTGETLAVGSQTGRWYVLDVQRREICSVHTDGSEQIECIEFSPDGSMIALGSRDSCIYVYACTESGRKFSRIGKCCGHSSFVTHVDWSSDGAHLVSTSGDYELLFWTAHNCRQVSTPSTLRDTSWASHRCTLGFHVAGIWPEGADGTDVNTCDRSSSEALVASGDDFGLVNLFRYPCFQPRSKGHSFQGHSSHVTNVRFLRNDSRLLSAGGRDCALIQWEIT